MLHKLKAIGQAFLQGNDAHPTLQQL